MKLKLRAYLTFVFIFCAFFRLSSQTNKPTRVSMPSWVIPMEPNYSAKVKTTEVDNGYYYLICDFQENVELSATYSHYAMKIVSDAGVQNSSEVSIDYDPSYQKLNIHKVDVIRDGKKIDKLDIGMMKILQRETSLERHIYDGSYTAVLILNDVRKGDVIEYAYTIKGKNPVFTNKFFTSFYLQYSVPLIKYSKRLICDSKRELVIKEYNNAPKHVTTTSGNETIYTWTVENPKVLFTEDIMPRWYDPYAYILVSEYSSWKDVKTWAKELFKESPVTNKEFKSRIEEIKEIENPEERALKAIRFVQNEIRYMGIEIGVYSHQPNSPDKVFQQRFGDCKDKSQLLCTILKEVGLEGHPVLVHSNDRGHIMERLPTPSAFNHCVAMLKVNNKEYWVDPTISYQGGDLKSNFFPEYKVGLVVTDDSPGLSNIGSKGNGSIRMTETFDIVDIGISPVELTVTTVYTGDEADAIRFEIANASRDEMEENYQNFYAKLYLNISRKDSIQIEDDIEKNILHIIEHYTLDNFWVKDSATSSSSLQGNFEAIFIESYLSNPKSKVRKMPIGLRYPTRITELIEVNLPVESSFNNESGSIRSEAMDFDYRYEYANRRLSLFYDYTIKKEMVNTKDIQEYMDNLDKIYKYATYGITYNGNSEGSASNEEEGVGGKTNWTLVAFILFYLVVVIYVLLKLYVKNWGPHSDEEPLFQTSLGGWMILPAIGLFLSPFAYLYNIFSSGYFDLDKLNNLSAQNDNWGFVFVFELITAVTMLVYVSMLLVLFLKRRNNFPKLYIAFLIANFVDVLSDTLICGALLGSEYYSLEGIPRTIVAGAIWIPYFLVSERVKTTFVKRHKSKNEQFQQV